MPSKIVIVGPAKSGKKEFINGLTLLSKNLGTKGVFGGVPSSSPPPVDTNEVTATSNSECASITTTFLLLETKYYSAPLELLLLPSSEFASSPASKQAKEALLGAEALIVVADSDALSKDADAISPFFSQMGALLDLIKGNSRKEEGEEKDGGGGGRGEEERERLVDDSICLLFCSNKCDIASGGAIPGAEADEEENGGGGSAAELMTSYGSGSTSNNTDTTMTSKTINQESSSSLSTQVDDKASTVGAVSNSTIPSGHISYLSFARSWCADNGFEHIEICAVKPLVGSRAREKSGVPRVLEALQSTMWSSMEKKTSPPLLQGKGVMSASSSLNTTRVSKAKIGGGGGGEEQCLTENGKMRVGGDVVGSAASDVTTTGDKTSSEGIIEALRRRAEGGGEEGEEEGLLGEGIVRMNDGQGGVKKEDEEEDGGPDLGALMDEMRRIRDSAHTGALTDEQRREAAAAMTMRLLAMMGGADEDEEEEEEGNE